MPSPVLQLLVKHPVYPLCRLSLHHALTHEQIRKYRSILYWSSIVSNPDIHFTREFIDEFHMQLMDKDIFANEFWHNDSVPYTVDLLERYYDFVNWESLSQCNKAMNQEEIRIRFALELLPYKPDLMDMSKKPPKEPTLEPPKTGFHEYVFGDGSSVIVDWDAYGQSKRQDLPWDAKLIETNADKLNWSMLSNNQSVPWDLDLLTRFQDKVDWGSDKYDADGTLSISCVGISSNEGIAWTIEMIEAFQDRLSFYALPLNPKIQWSLEMLERFEHRWEWDMLAYSDNCWQQVFGHLTEDEVLQALLEAENN